MKKHMGHEHFEAMEDVRTLRERRLFDVEVEVILADDSMIEPYTYDWTLRVEAIDAFDADFRSFSMVFGLVLYGFMLIFMHFPRF